LQGPLRTVILYDHVTQFVFGNHTFIIALYALCSFLVYRWTAVSVGNMFQNLLWLQKAADNTERYM